MCGVCVQEDGEEHLVRRQEGLLPGVCHQELDAAEANIFRDQEKKKQRVLVMLLKNSFYSLFPFSLFHLFIYFYHFDH